LIAILIRKQDTTATPAPFNCFAILNFREALIVGNRVSGKTPSRWFVNKSQRLVSGAPHP